jgi:hypothetical protein
MGKKAVKIAVKTALKTALTRKNALPKVLQA